MSNVIKFGTDGWRGVIAEDFTFDNVRACAQGVATYLKQSGLASRGLLIGYDTRFASEDFAAATAEVVAANGIKVLLCPKPAPTPVVSFGVTEAKTAGGVIITASHNPGIYNGFKFKNEQGSSAPDETTSQIEKAIGQALANKKIKRMPLAEAIAQKRVEYRDLMPAYLAQLRRLVDTDNLRRAGLKVVIDPMYGAGAGYLRQVLEGGKTAVTEIQGERNPLFPGMGHPEPIAVNLTRLSDTVKKLNADVGLATDGDADRMGIIDENGRFITQLQVFALLCLYLLEVCGERGPLVKTITTTSMVYRLGKIFNVPVYETPVGFKYIAPLMQEKKAIIGGEESGGYGFRGHVLERDGILGNLYFLDLMVRTGKKPAQLLEYLFSKVGPHFYERLDITFPEAERQAIIERLKQSRVDSIGEVTVARRDETDGLRLLLPDESWLLIRFSGTEPVLRVYAEASSTARVEKMLEFSKKLAGV